MILMCSHCFLIEMIENSEESKSSYQLFIIVIFLLYQISFRFTLCPSVCSLSYKQILSKRNFLPTFSFPDNDRNRRWRRTWGVEQRENTEEEEVNGKVSLYLLVTNKSVSLNGETFTRTGTITLHVREWPIIAGIRGRKNWFFGRKKVV